MKKGQLMYTHPHELYESCKQHHQDLIREASLGRLDQMWVNQRLGHMLNWLGDRLTTWGQSLQTEQRAIEIRVN